jgi:hippurate hydrolase
MQASVEIHHGMGPCVNHKPEADLAAEACAAAGIPTRRDLHPAMTGEDFGLFLQEIPGAFVWIGNGPADDARELHSPNYDFNDAILPAAAGFLAGVAKRALLG